MHPSCLQHQQVRKVTCPKLASDQLSIPWSLELHSGDTTGDTKPCCQQMYNLIQSITLDCWILHYPVRVDSSFFFALQPWDVHMRTLPNSRLVWHYVHQWSEKLWCKWMTCKNLTHNCVAFLQAKRSQTTMQLVGSCNSGRCIGEALSPVQGTL